MIADSLIPIFAGLLLGYLAGRWGAADNQDVRTLTLFVTGFSIPSAIFLAAAGVPPATLHSQIAIAAVLAILYIVFYALCYMWSRFQLRLGPSDAAVVALTVAFPNSAALGLPLLRSAFGPHSAVAVATSITIGVITVSPLTLAILEAHGNRAVDVETRTGLIRPLLRAVRKPIVWAPLLGLLFSCARWDLPSFATRSLEIFAAAADGTALVLTGLVVSALALQVNTSTLSILILKCLLQPLVALVIARLFRLPLDQVRYVTLIGALPCGFFGVVFSKSYGIVPAVAGSGLFASYILSIVTLPAWIAVLNLLR